MSESQKHSPSSGRSWAGAIPRAVAVGVSILAITITWFIRIGGSPILRHLNTYFSSIDNFAMQGIHCVLGVASFIKANECEPSRFLLVAISRDINVAEIAVFREHTFQISNGCTISEVVYFQTSHTFDGRRTPLAVERHCRGKNSLLLQHNMASFLQARVGKYEK